MIKSPMNYIGGKYKLLPQILPLFPKEIGTFVDLFSGGLDVSLNINAKNIICNDINHYVIGLFQYLQGQSIEEIICNIHDMIDKYGLTKENSEGYYALRSEYNRSHSPLHLFLLICYGFNHQIRFNNLGEFNNPFGKDRSSYNVQTERNLKLMHERLKYMHFHTGNFRDFDVNFLHSGDFLYADPPYLISCGSYNDGRRGFEGWSEDDDKALYRKMDVLNERGVCFALSNVTRHKGIENDTLIKWARDYNVHLIKASYANSNYQARKSDTIEVLITNY